MSGLAERQIALVDWARLRSLDGHSAEVGDALRDLLSAGSADEASAAYWRLENHVVVQGSVFEAAESVASVLVAALSEERAFYVRVSALELLYQIVSGEPDESERSQGNVDLVTRSRVAAREGLWSLIREYSSGATDAAADVLRIIDPDHFEAFG